MSVAIVDYQTGNLGSVAQALTSLGVSSRIISTANEVSVAQLIILPGQGAIGEAMRFLRKTQMDQALINFAQNKGPILGICLGMQMMMDGSEEDGGCEGLGLIPGRVKKFTADMDRRVPHMGWNTIEVVQDQHAYYKGIQSPAYLYFAHSYFVEPTDKGIISTLTDYKGPIVSSVQQGSLFGIQAHPEKSGVVGLSILQNFLSTWGIL